MFRNLLAFLVLSAVLSTPALALYDRDKTYPEPWRGEVTGIGELDKCPFGDDKELFINAVYGYLDPEVYTSAEISVMTVAEFEELVLDRWRKVGVDLNDPSFYTEPGYHTKDPGSRFETFSCGEWSEGKDWDVIVVEIKKNESSGEGSGNRFELGAEQTETLPDDPQEPFDGTGGTPESDQSGNTGITGGTSSDTGGGQSAHLAPDSGVTAPPPGCGQPASDLGKAYEDAKRSLEDFGYGALENYEQIVGNFAPPVEALLFLDPSKPRLSETMAWRAQGVKTQSDKSQFGCFQAAIAQDLRWHTGKPYLARPRTFDLPWGLSLEAAGGAGPGGEAAVLQRIYGGQNHILKYAIKGVLSHDEIRAPHWIQVSKYQLDQLISEYGGRGGHPRGLVSFTYDNSPVSHVVNVRWNGAGQVELWDASAGEYADLTHVNRMWFFPTN